MSKHVICHLKCQDSGKSDEGIGPAVLAFDAVRAPVILVRQTPGFGRLHEPEVGVFWWMQSSQPFAAASVQEPWSAGAFDSLRLFSLHLIAIGGSGAAARTAVAPLERIKVCLAFRGWAATVLWSQSYMSADFVTSRRCQQYRSQAAPWQFSECCLANISARGLQGKC